MTISFRRWVFILVLVVCMIGAWLSHIREFRVVFGGTQPASGSKLGKTKKNPKDQLKYAWIVPGTFQMGCSEGDEECTAEEKPQHPITITKGFWIAQTEITVAAYKRYVKATGKSMPSEPVLLGRVLNKEWKNEKQPIANVSWEDARDYCTWVEGRLPTDAEWEYAARGGDPKARYGPLEEIAWYADNSGQQRLDSTALKAEDLKTYGGGRKILNQRLKDNGNGAHDVGTKRANAFGLFDMIGNQWEWVNDWHIQTYYQEGPAQDPPGPSEGQVKLTRGASWDDVPQYQRVSFNHKGRVQLKDPTLGFRCVWNWPKP